MDSSVGISIPDAKSMPAERLFERQWALAMLETVLSRLEAEFAIAGKSAAYDLLKPSLTAPRNGTDYNAIAAELNVQPVSARSAVHRLRRRFKELFREEVSHTVDDSTSVDEELRAVIAALGTTI
jgi:RNA polymerase sigma-70 factor (ECF subfamily)